MSLTDGINRLMEESARLNVRLAGRLKGSGLDFLIWASPSSCRSPEEIRLWHPVYIRKPPLFKIAVYVYILCLYTAVGIARFFSYRGFYFNYRKNRSPVLLIIPDEITDHSLQAKTEYVIEDDDYPVDKLVFSRLRAIGPRFSGLSCYSKLKIFLRLLGATLGDFRETMRNKKITTAYLDAFIVFLRWVISQSWCFHWDFYGLLNNTIAVNDQGYKVLLSLHEMHFYSKVIWRTAHERNLIGVTAQHAMIIPEKLWYFPHPSEVKAGCRLPDVFFVYSNEIIKLLEPFYPGTKFTLCCSPRFKKWKADKTGVHQRTPHPANNSILFVSGIMAYDVAILVQGIRKLLSQDLPGLRIRLRLHPYASIQTLDKFWIKALRKFGKIEITKNALSDDLGTAALVIGSNSTVLQEAALVGIPVLGIYNGDFVRSAVLPDSQDWCVPVNALSAARIEEQRGRTFEDSFIRRFKENMGLFNPDLTTGLILGCGD